MQRVRVSVEQRAQMRVQEALQRRLEALEDASDYDSEGSAAEAEQDENAAPAKEASPEPAKAKRVVNRKPRPKLTVELLKEEGGLTHVYEKFFHTFAAEAKGVGHEAGDLRRLLELYGRWQRRLFPHCEFDDFVERLEKLSSSSTLKLELIELRQNLMSLVTADEEPTFAPEPNDAPAPGSYSPAALRVTTSAANRAGARGATQGGDDDDEYDDMDEGDELLAMQREAEMDAAMEAADDFGHGFDDYGDGSDDDSVGGGARSAPAQAASRAAAAPTQPKAYPEEEDDDAMADAFDDLLDELEDDRALEGGEDAATRPRPASPVRAGVSPEAHRTTAASPPAVSAPQEASNADGGAEDDDLLRIADTLETAFEARFTDDDAELLGLIEQLHDDSQVGTQPQAATQAASLPAAATQVLSPAGGADDAELLDLLDGSGTQTTAGRVRSARALLLDDSDDE